MLNIGFDHLLIRPHRGDEIAPGPEFVPHTVARFMGNILGNPDRALAFQKPQDVGHTVFGRNADEQVAVIGHPLPGLNYALLLLRQPRKHLFQVPPQPPLEQFLAVFRGEHHVVRAVPRAMIQLVPSCRHRRSPDVMLRAVEPFWEIFRGGKTLGFLQQSWRLSIWDS